MRCTDSLENVAVWLGLKAAQWVSAQSVKIVCLGYFVPEVFDSNRRLCIASRPKQRCTFSAGDNTRTFSLCSLRCCHNGIAHGFLESNRIRLIVHHECRERFGSVQ